MATPLTPDDEHQAAVRRLEIRLIERLKDLEQREYNRLREATAAASPASTVSNSTPTRRSPLKGAMQQPSSRPPPAGLLSHDAATTALRTQNVRQQGRSLLLQDMLQDKLRCGWHGSFSTAVHSICTRCCVRNLVESGMVRWYCRCS